MTRAATRKKDEGGPKQDEASQLASAPDLENMRRNCWLWQQQRKTFVGWFQPQILGRSYVLEVWWFGGFSQPLIEAFV